MPDGGARAARPAGCSPPSWPTACGWDELLTWPQDEKDLAAETLYRFAFGSLYRLRAFNGDPHPGNYLFHPGGRVTFLDFGLVKHFTHDELDDFEEMIRRMVLDHDPAGVPARSSSGSACCRPGLPFTDDEVVDYFGHFYEFVRVDGAVHDHPRVRLGDGAPLLRHVGPLRRRS